MSDLATLLAKDAIAHRVHELFIATDEREWARVRACFAPTVRFDMSSLGAGPPTELTPMQITDAWDSGLKPLEHVHHQTGNLQIEVSGSTATAFCYGVALHYRKTRDGNNIRRFVGSYDFSLVLRSPSGWAIRAFRFNAKFIDGNLSLETAPQ